MAGEITTPLLPCAQIEEIMRFYEALGFRTTYRRKRPNGETPPRDAGRSALAAALHGAALLGDSKGDFQVSAQLLDKALAGAGTASDADRIAALAYRAELAIGLDDPSGAQRFLAQLGTIPLDEATRCKTTSHGPTTCGNRSQLSSKGRGPPPDVSPRPLCVSASLRQPLVTAPPPPHGP